MSLTEDQKENMKKLEKEEKQEGRTDIARDFIHAIIDKIKGKSIRKQLEFLLNPERIETSTRLSQHQVLALNMADWLGRTMERFQPLRDFFVGFEKEDGTYDGGGFARWIISDRGLGRTEGISFIQASTEQKVIPTVFSALKGKEEK